MDEPGFGETAKMSDNRLDAIERLAQLRDAGTLTAEEFEAEKARLLRGGINARQREERRHKDALTIGDWCPERLHGVALGEVVPLSVGLLLPRPAAG